MANQFFPSGRRALISGDTLVLTDDVRAALVRGYTYNSAHAFLSDVTGAGATIVARSGALTSKSLSSDGTFDAADDTFGTPTAQAAAETVILFEHTGSDATARLVFMMTDAPGLPVTPDGATPIPIQWNAAGIFSLTG